MATKQQLEDGLNQINNINTNVAIIAEKTEKVEKHLATLNGTVATHGNDLIALESSRKEKWHANDIEFRDIKASIDRLLNNMPSVRLSFKQFLLYSISLAVISLGGAYAVAQYVVT